MAIVVDATQPKLEHLFDMHADLEAPQLVGGSSGARQIFIVKGGRVDGPKVSGELLPGGGDWAIVRADGAYHLDVRATIKTDDGALIYATYSGLIVIPPEVLPRIFGGEDVPLSEYYFYTNPMFETADERYAWLTQRLAIGRGRSVPGGVEYRVWTVEQPG